MTKNKTNTTNRKNIKIPVLILCVVLILALCYGGYAYVNDYYHSLDVAIDATKSTDTVTVSTLGEDTLCFTPTNEIIAGLIFYPGGKVEYTAYAPLMQKLAQNGFLCILPHVNCNLAILETNAADGYIELFPDVETWYLGGHSLGGTVASMYASSHASEFDGLILLASYSTKDLSDSGLEVFSIYGSNDKVLRMDQYEKNRINLPVDTHQYIIEGGCHAYFGSYGPQAGDGEPSITNDEQLDSTVDYICYTGLGL